MQEENTYISAMLEGMGGRAGMTNRTGGKIANVNVNNLKGVAC